VATTFPHCAMRNTNSPLNEPIVTPLMAAIFLHPRRFTMCGTDSPLLHGFVGTPFIAALSILLYFYCAVAVGDTNSSLNGTVGTSLNAAFLCLSAMCNTNSSLNYMFVTSLEAASFICHFCAVSDTNSSLLGFICTSLKAASLSPTILLFRCRDIPCGRISSSS
jgi:hypothetical protein